MHGERKTSKNNSQSTLDGMSTEIIMLTAFEGLRYVMQNERI
jgi:hypothetical protein